MTSADLAVTRFISIIGASIVTCVVVICLTIHFQPLPQQPVVPKFQLVCRAHPDPVIAWFVADCSVNPK